MTGCVGGSLKFCRVIDMRWEFCNERYRKNFLHLAARYAILDIRIGATAHKVVDLQ